MQVIFHAVDQLKLLQSEETSQSSTTMRISLTSPITHMAQNQPSTIQYSSTTTTSATLSDKAKDEEKERNKAEEASTDKIEEASTDKTEESSKNKVEESFKDQLQYPSEEKIEETKVQDSSEDKIFKIDERLDDKMEGQETQEALEDKLEESEDKIEETSKLEKIGEESNSQVHQESPEVNEETPETNYATPEMNYEMAEDVHAVQETNEEVPEENQEWIPSHGNVETGSEIVTAMGKPTDSSVNRESMDENEEKKKEPTIDSVVQDVYEILKPTPSKFVDQDVTEVSGESKNVLGVPVDKTENVEDEDDETRFTRLGEKVTQVPRPSLSSYLRRSKVPPSATLQQLASLYDSLSKDARKQGFGKYTGYSDEVLNTLETSAEGGVGPQLMKILTKMLERNELTRDDAKTRSSQAIRDLDNSSSILSKELRPLLPLRYTS
ncbi:hypothetical protein WH47_09877 [Habropoda laboriosa]|uniref:Uncharacterized protein n=2 Tax=Habropoda laboriosa TaxID=597456 RepID=A0A0L7R383_9HYME|nr:hypothetical protein WH47_09877 [Habropoda laboriosa]